MSRRTEFFCNRANLADLSAYLSLCDGLFSPPLNRLVNINTYAQKIQDNATRFEAWYGRRLVGLIAAYCNASDKKIAFITSISVVPEWQGHGIASELISRCIQHIRNQEFWFIELEVDSSNYAALSLYKKFQFATLEARNGTMLMNLKVRA
jgi:ribosomal protein S18 acetylase RimI-like enzyme